VNRRLVALVVAVVVVPKAYAQGEPATSAAFVRGRQLYDLGRYAEAAEAFRAAYAQAPKPAILFAVAQAERLAGDCLRAAAHYRAFLRTEPTEPWRSFARQHLETCSAQIPPSAPAPAHERPLPPPPARAEDVPPAWYRDWIGGTLCAIGTASLVAGTVVWWSGRRDAEEANGARQYDRYWEHAQGASLRQTIGVGAMIGGGALILGGGLRYLLASRPSEDGVAVAIDPSARAFVVAGRF
jgi:hypothetical protein